METISEAAAEYATQERTTRSEQSAFADGALWVQQWISVENKLPKNLGTVLVKTKTSNCTSYLTGYYENGKWRVWGFGNIGKVITHWRQIKIK